MKAFFLIGATATGKSAVAHHIARKHGWAILSADAMLIYAGMDIGTAKPSAEERAECRYGGIDLARPSDGFNVWQYRQHALTFLRECEQDGVPVIVAGGSGLYVKALTHGLGSAGAGSGDHSEWQKILAETGVEGLQQALHERAPVALERLADPKNPRRLIRALERGDAADAGWGSGGKVPPMPGLRRDRSDLDARIRDRVARMLDRGLEAEVVGIRDRYAPLSGTAMQAIGYAEIAAVLDEKMSLKEAEERTVVRTRRLAKKQRTWFRHQATIDWIDVERDADVADVAKRVEPSWREHGAIEIAHD